MKKITLFAVAFIAITTTSCRKELVTNDLQSSQTSSAENAAGNTLTTSVNKLPLSKTSTNYGAWIIASLTETDTYGFVTNVAGDLGLSCIRDITPVPGSKKVKNMLSEYNVLLNFSSVNPKPMKFRTDLTAYKNDLETTLSALNGMPVVAVIENEESNKGYYSGSPYDYINQLKTAITVMHNHGIKVANGGITSTGLKYLVYQDYMSRGMTAQANDYKKRMKIAVNNPDTQERSNFISVLIAAYANMNLDYVNFHWRSQTPGDAQGLGETIDYLKKATGKTVLSNEIGQYDKDPATLTASVQMCTNYNFPYIIWYSGQEDDRSYPLQYANKVLTKTGTAYQAYISNK